MSDISELLERFRHSPSVLERAIDGVTDEESKFSPAPGKWNIRQIVRHIADTEIVAGMRLRLILAEDRPVLSLFDQDQWAANLNYNASDPSDALLDFGVLRELNAEMLAVLPAEAFDREGLHPVLGVTTARQWVDRFTTHVERHAEQIRAARQAWANQAAVKKQH